MKLKKVMALTLAGVMALSAVGCGDIGSEKTDSAATSKTEEKATDTAATTDTAASDIKSLNDGKLVIWTLANDLVSFGERFQEQTGVEVETVVIEPANYPTKVQTALLGGETEPDIIVGEPQMLEDFYDAGFFEDLNQFGAQDYADQIVDYVWDVGQDADGIQRAISYQITPAGFYYRRDIAKEVFGTDDPTEVGKLFADYTTILETAQILKDADYRIFASDAESFNAATEGYETTQVFAYGLPAWGVLTMRDNVGETSGSWGVCAGPAYGFGGGTYIGVSSRSERKETAWEFVKFCTLNEETANWWIEFSEGDTVSLIPALEAHKDDENAVYGGQKLYAFWLEQAKGIDYSKVTRYDKAIGDAWGNAISAIKTGEKTKEEAVAEFYDVVESTYPEITVNR